MVLFLYLLIICYQAQFLAQHCVLELAQYEAVFYQNSVTTIRVGM